MCTPLFDLEILIPTFADQEIFKSCIKIFVASVISDETKNTSMSEILCTLYAE